MAVKTESHSRFSSPLARLGRMSKHGGVARKSVAAAEDWYIPYNGPYEEPRKEEREQRLRDSWGDIIQQDRFSDLGNDLHTRYGSELEPHENYAHNHPREYSSLSSPAVDSTRASIGTTRTSVNSAHAHKIPHIQHGGGVGQSPAPPARKVSPSTSQSIANFFAFGSKKSTARTSGQDAGRKRALSELPHPPQATFTAIPSSITALLNEEVIDLTASAHSASGIRDSVTTNSTEDEEYYHSYRSTNRNAALLNVRPRRAPTSPVIEVSETLSLSSHPYAYSFPAIPANQVTIQEQVYSAPIDSAFNVKQPLVSPRLLSASNHNLKASISTPNLRASPSPLVLQHSNFKPKKSQLPKGKDRWLSAETWCDALLFPRPRFKVKADKAGKADTVKPSGGSGRIVSPPGSPPGVWGTSNDNGTVVTSRVLAHSRSVVELRARNNADKFREDESPIAERSKSTGHPTNRAGVLTLPSQKPPSTVHTQAHVPTGNTERAPRPQSWALDDLALPTPVPSLSRVLAEGQKLDEQRKEWQSQATTSFQNNRTRSMSRLRSKSLVQRNKTKADKNTAFETLTASTFLGSQARAPAVVINTPPPVPPKKQTNTASSHGRSNSLSKTLSKSSHKRGHSRGDSWSNKGSSFKHVLLCGLNGEDAETTVTQHYDQPVVSNFGASTHSHGAGTISPVPSGISENYSRVGIALSTPPLVDNRSSTSHSTYELPSHPYAQGSYRSPRTEVIASDFAGPHPSSVNTHSRNLSNGGATDVSARHRLPPQATMMSTHPYARAMNNTNNHEDDDVVPFLPHSMVSRRDISPHSTMWAQLSPGIMREVLPGDISYSPFMDSARNTPEQRISDPSEQPGLDATQAGEALSQVKRVSKDSGIGASEDHNQAMRATRALVQQDASRPYQFSSHPSVMTGVLPFSPLLKLTPPSASDHDPIAALNVPRSANISPAITASSSETPSPDPRSFGNPNDDDLSGYRDLFYRPNHESFASAIGSQGESETWADVRKVSRRTDSGLTSLARQLSQEFEEINAEDPRQSVDSSFTSQMPRLSDRRHVEGNNLHFVLSQTGDQHATSQPTSPLRLPEHKIPFHVPEDVSSRASSMLDVDILPSEENPDIGVFRMGIVEAVSTPPPMTASNPMRMSAYLSVEHAPGQTSGPGPPTNSDNEKESPTQFRQVPSRISGFLASDPSTRASYITSASSASRMSGLSEFPEPPLMEDAIRMGTPQIPQTQTEYFPKQDSSGWPNVLNHSQSSVFYSAAETPGSESEEVDSYYRSSPVLNPRRMTFGGDQDVEDIASALSSTLQH